MTSRTGKEGRLATAKKKTPQESTSPTLSPTRYISKAREIVEEIKNDKKKIEERINSPAVSFTLEGKLITNEYYSRSNSGQAPFTTRLTQSFPMPGALCFYTCPHYRRHRQC